MSGPGLLRVPFPKGLVHTINPGPTCSAKCLTTSLGVHLAWIFLIRCLEKVPNKQIISNGGGFGGDFHPMGSQAVKNHLKNKSKLVTP